MSEFTAWRDELAETRLDPRGLQWLKPKRSWLAALRRPLKLLIPAPGSGHRPARGQAPAGTQIHHESPPDGR